MRGSPAVYIFPRHLEFIDCQLFDGGLHLLGDQVLVNTAIPRLLPESVVENGDTQQFVI